MATIKSTVTTENRINANVSPPSKIVPKNVVLRDITAASFGLENVDNTRDIDKPISTATQTALSTNATDIATNATDIGTANTNIATNVTNIATNASAISAEITRVTAAEGVNATDISTANTNIATNATDIATNVTNIATNATDIATANTNIATNATDKAPINNPTFTGNPQSNAAPSSADHLTNKTYVDTQVAGIVDSAPEALDTLNELAAALGDDANFATTTATFYWYCQHEHSN